MKGNSSYRKKNPLFDARPPNHQHSQSNNQVWPRENLINNATVYSMLLV